MAAERPGGKLPQSTCLGRKFFSPALTGMHNLLLRMDSQPFMTEEELAVFAELTRRYFERTMDEGVEFSGATFSFGPPQFEDFTGLIRISGPCNGYIFISLAQLLLTEMLDRMGETQKTAEVCRDFVGDLASSIAGSAREHFGARLRISTPIAMTAREAERVDWPPSHLCLPFHTMGQRSTLVISLERTDPQ